jgi:hypothetical protein
MYINYLSLILIIKRGKPQENVALLESPAATAGSKGKQADRHRVSDQQQLYNRQMELEAPKKPAAQATVSRKKSRN